MISHFRSTFRSTHAAPAIVAGLAALMLAVSADVAQAGTPVSHATYQKSARGALQFAHWSLHHPPRINYYHPGYIDAVPTYSGGYDGGWAYDSWSYGAGSYGAAGCCGGGWGGWGWSGYGYGYGYAAPAHFTYHPAVTADYGYVGNSYPYPYSFGAYYSPIGGYQDSYFHPYYTAYYGLPPYYGPIWYGW